VTPARSFAAAALLAGGLAGCGPGAPLPQTYVLPDPAADPPPVSQMSLPIVLVRPVDVPDYLDSTDIVTRGPDGLIVARQSARWGERLSVGLTRAVTERLASRFPQCLVTASPPMRQPRWRVRVEVEALDIGAEGPAMLTARWNIADGATGHIVAAERLTLSAPGDLRSDAAAVAAIGRDVDQLVERIADALAPAIGR
jgi:hypothetical protein